MNKAIVRDPRMKGAEEVAQNRRERYSSTLIGLIYRPRHFCQQNSLVFVPANFNNYKTYYILISTYNSNLEK